MLKKNCENKEFPISAIRLQFCQFEVVSFMFCQFYVLSDLGFIILRFFQF